MQKYKTHQLGCTHAMPKNEPNNNTAGILSARIMVYPFHYN